MKDIDGYDTIKKSLDDLKEETDKWLKSNFEQWRDESLSSISMGDLTCVFFFCSHSLVFSSSSSYFQCSLLTLNLV